jgi:hypothetical protein
MNVRCTKSKGVLPDFFGKLDSTLGPCFYFKNSCGSSKTADAQPGMRIGALLEKRRITEFQLAGHPESDKADVAPERR